MNKNLFLNSESINNTYFSECLKMNLEYYKFKAGNQNKHFLEMDEYLVCIVVPINNYQIIIKMVDSNEDKIEFDMFGRMCNVKLLQNKIYIARMYIKDISIRYFESISVISVIDLESDEEVEFNKYISNFDDICILCNRAIIHHFNNSQPFQSVTEYGKIYINYF